MVDLEDIYAKLYEAYLVETPEGKPSNLVLVKMNYCEQDQLSRQIMVNRVPKESNSVYVLLRFKSDLSNKFYSSTANERNGAIKPVVAVYNGKLAVKNSQGQGVDKDRFKCHLYWKVSIHQDTWPVYQVSQTIAEEDGLEAINAALSGMNIG